MFVPMNLKISHLHMHVSVQKTTRIKNNMALSVSAQYFC